ncbi:S8/S53 family peptidase [Bradyrhizobium sp. BRP22]|uniref:S53 family peptidase n=1 Tax=Bradyrhizobium sp. BRP22 TaxID=2793821 RepID=UPI001CD36F62|nr:S53 family peptidase [Bradyrhizobium sp. BRP22]MCA1454229.1 S8/S53 family peptidase [Bradyrhizobium sp. BRP22]
MTDHRDLSILQDSALPKHLLQAREAAADPDQVLRATLRLVPRCGDAALLARASALGRQPIAGRGFLTRDTLADEVTPLPEALDAVKAFCQQYGFTLSRTALGGLFVTIEGKACALARAFGVAIGRYHHGDLVLRAYEGALSLPAALAPYVRAVLGLDDLSRLAALPDASAFTEPPSLKGNLPTTVAFDYYQYPQHLTGQGTTVAFIEQDLRVDLDEIEAYYRKLGLGPVSIVLVPEWGPPKAQDDPMRPKRNGEAMMDLMLTGAVAPGATLVGYAIVQDYGYSSDPWVDTLIAALENDKHPCSVMSISLGQPESSWSTQTALSVNFLFAIAGLLGVTVCVASGDFGAPGDVDNGGTYRQNCAFPASSPFCLACGGTELVLTQQGDQRVLTGEVVWNEMTEIGQKLATGGGISTLFPVPDFQQTLTLPVPFNEGQTAGRGLPDVASNGASNSSYDVGYGTSAAAPMWAALMALLVEGNGGTPIGYLNPRLYELQLGGTECCKPITEGDNGPPDSNISFPAGKPWNACCGLGSPLGSSLATALGIGATTSQRQPRRKTAVEAASL